MQRGFSVLELLVVIAIIGIVAALTWPQMGSSAGTDLDNAARELAADLRLTQQMTVNSAGSATPLLVFSNAAPYGYYISVNAQLIKPRTKFPATVQTSGNPGAITFSLDGKPTGTANATIILVNTKGASRSIITEVMTGRIRIQ
jgi:prepilin-type N-terminal cleavage/methylation domain-containing protein